MQARYTHPSGSSSESHMEPVVSVLPLEDDALALLVDVLLICKHAMQISDLLACAPEMTHPA